MPPNLSARSKRLSPADGTIGSQHRYGRRLPCLVRFARILCGLDFIKAPCNLLAQECECDAPGCCKGSWADQRHRIDLELEIISAIPATSGNSPFGIARSKLPLFGVLISRERSVLSTVSGAAARLLQQTPWPSSARCSSSPLLPLPTERLFPRGQDATDHSNQHPGKHSLCGAPAVVTASQRWRRTFLFGGPCLSLSVSSLSFGDSNDGRATLRPFSFYREVFSATPRPKAFDGPVQ